MYDQGYYGEMIIARRYEELERQLELRRSLSERADQIVPRAEGPVRRMLRRMLRGTPRPVSGATASAPETATGRAAPTSPARVVEAAPAR